MPTDLQNTWDSIATQWDKWKAPLRPCAEDTTLMENALSAWHADGYAPDGYAQAIILGVTPEIVNMTFPSPTQILAIDRSQAMIDHVWPGDVSDSRKAVVGDWLTYALNYRSQDIVLADGSLVFFNPSNVDRLVSNVAHALKKNGIFVSRCFTQSESKESITMLLRAARDGYITNYHEFKFQVAMSIQRNFEDGVIQNDIYTNMEMVKKFIAPDTFSADDLSTGELYKNKKAKHYYPTAAELTTILSKYFTHVEIVYPTGYSFANHCPTVIARNVKE